MRQSHKHVLDIFQPVHSSGVKRITGQAFSCVSWMTEGTFLSLEMCTEVWHILAHNEQLEWKLSIYFHSLSSIHTLVRSIFENELRHSHLLSAICSSSTLWICRVA